MAEGCSDLGHLNIIPYTTEDHHSKDPRCLKL